MKARPKYQRLTGEEWAEVVRLTKIGKSPKEIAEKFGVSISTIHKGLSALTEVAREKAEADSASNLISAKLQSFEPGKRDAVVMLADMLRNISVHLGSAAELGAMSAHRLAYLANAQIAKVDEDDPFSGESNRALIGAAALTKMANSSAEIALNLLAANKETIKELNKPDPSKMPKRMIVMKVVE